MYVGVHKCDCIFKVAMKTGNYENKLYCWYCFVFTKFAFIYAKTIGNVIAVICKVHIG